MLFEDDVFDFFCEFGYALYGTVDGVVVEVESFERVFVVGVVDVDDKVSAVV